MNSSKRYEYVMDEAEIREFCLHAFLEQLKYSKKTGIRLLVILAAELLLIPETAALTLLLVIVMVAAVGIYNYTATSRLLRGQPGSVWIEGDKLKAQRRDYGEIPCRDIKLVLRTKRLLMMGYMQRAGRPAWFMIPLRSFRDGHEVDLFLAMMRNPTAQENCYDQTSQCDAEILRFQYQLDLERWVRLQKGAADLVNGGSLGSTARLYGMLALGCVMLAALVSVSCLVAKKFDWLIVGYSFALTILLILKLYYTDPEKLIRKQLMSPEAAARACGLWQVSLTEEGVSLTMPADIKNMYLWTSLAWMVETEEAFYLFHRDKKHFVMIAKESFQSWDQVRFFHQVCADHGIQKAAPKKARYVPLWLLVALFVVCLLALFGIAIVRAALTKKDEPGVASGDVYERISLEEQVEVLKSLGLHVPEETG